VLGRIRNRALTRLRRRELLAQALAAHTSAATDVTRTVEVETTFAGLYLNREDTVTFDRSATPRGRAQESRRPFSTDGDCVTGEESTPRSRRTSAARRCTPEARTP